MADVDGTGSVPTWRDGVLTREEKDRLTAEQWRQYTDDSVIRDLSDIDQLPRPARSWAQGAVDRARVHAEARITEQEHREASWHPFAATDLPRRGRALRRRVGHPVSITVDVSAVPESDEGL